MILIYMPSYAVNQLGLPLSAPFLATAIGGTVLAISALGGGWLADMKPPGYGVIISALVLLIVAPVPLFFWLLQAPSLAVLITIDILLAIPLGAMNGIVPALMAAAFPASLRATGLGVAYNLSSAFLGGTSLLVVTILINQTGDRLMPAYYIIAASLYSLISLLALRRMLMSRKIFTQISKAE
jgi:MHS family proline/betaine transporter-like MFS transporter